MATGSRVREPPFGPIWDWLYCNPMPAGLRTPHSGGRVVIMSCRLWNQLTPIRATSWCATIMRGEHVNSSAWLSAAAAE